MKKLTPADVLEIRRRIANKELNKAIARDFGVDPSTISDIKRKKRRRKVNQKDLQQDDNELLLLDGDIAKFIPGFGNYAATVAGEIYSRKTGWWKRLPKSVSQTGYYRVYLKDDEGRRRNAGVHRLVLLAFVGECPDGQLGRHLDGNPRNNRLENLAYGTQKDNKADQERHGNTLRGEDVGNAKLTADQVLEIRNSNLTNAELSRRYGVGQPQIHRIRSGTRWTHLIKGHR